MPYFVDANAAGCDGWATVKDDGEVLGCHLSKDEAIDQMVALSLAEGIEPGGERSDMVRSVDLTVPGYMSSAAALGVELWEAGMAGDGVTDQTIAEARAMADGDITEDKVVRANAWAARHAVDLEASQNTDTDDDGWPGAGAVAHYLWGINPLDPEPAREWFARKAAEIQAEQAEYDESESGRAAVRSGEQVRQLAFSVAPSDDGLTLDGYGAVFDSWTTIEDAYGQFRERIMPGAFKRSLGQRLPVLQFDHGSHPLIGSIPLGRITSIMEDERGLRVRARLSDNWLVEPVRDAIRDGAITGMSFRFRVIADSWAMAADGVEERTISEVALFEVGPVVFPAYEATTVSVRSRWLDRLLDDPQARDHARAILSADSFTVGSDSFHLTGKEPSVVGHGSVRSRTQRRACAWLVGIDSGVDNVQRGRSARSD